MKINLDLVARRAILKPMSELIAGTRMIRGVEVEIYAEIDVVACDDSFNHAFGTEHAWHPEVEHISEIVADCDIRERVIDEFHARGIVTHNRRFWKMVRQMVRNIEAAISAMDPDSTWQDKEIERAIEGWEPPDIVYSEDDDFDSNDRWENF